MRRVFLLSAFCLAAGSISACKPEEVIPTENIPTAGVRFINAVPDTAGAFGLDFRWVDQLESNAHFRINFRNNPVTASGTTAATAVQYKGARAGQRHFRIFLDDTIASIATVVLKDSTVTLEAGRNYTAILWGYSRTAATPAMRLTFFEETVADPGANVALRVINATANAIDAWHYANGGTVPATPSWANVPPLSASAFVMEDSAGLRRFNVRPAGGGASLFADGLFLQGDTAFSTAGPAGKKDIEANPGTRVKGSAVTLIVFPPSTVGARTPQSAAFLVTAGASIWDRRPPYVVP